MHQKLLAALLFVTSCYTPTVAYDPVTPAPIAPPDSDFCAPMCQKWQSLKCPQGDDVYNNDIPGPDGVPNQKCTDWCKEEQVKGVFLNPRCTKSVTKCEDIEPYRQKDPATCL